MTKVNVVAEIIEWNGEVKTTKFMLELKGKKLDEQTIEKRVNNNIKDLQSKYNQGSSFKAKWNLIKYNVIG